MLKLNNVLSAGRGGVRCLGSQIFSPFIIEIHVDLPMHLKLSEINSDSKKERIFRKGTLIDLIVCFPFQRHILGYVPLPFYHASAAKGV